MAFEDAVNDVMEKTSSIDNLLEELKSCELIQSRLAEKLGKV